MKRTIGLVILVACAGGKPAVKPATATSSLAASLVAELGTPLAILPTAGGLLAVSADGRKQRPILGEPAAWALVDNRARVVWFGTPGSIRVLDLERDQAVAEDVLTGLPGEVIEGTPGIRVSYADDHDELEVGHPAYHKLVLVMGASPELVGDPGVWTDDEEFPAAVAAVKLSPAVTQRLVELWKRGEGRKVALPAGEKPVGPVEVDPAGCPDDEEMCGQAVEIPGTSLWRVTVELSCGDGCYPVYRAYDPGQKTFVEGDWARHLQMAWISPDGKALVDGGAIVRLDSGETVFAGSEGVQGGGWLGEAYYLGF